ncbi:MAG: lysoplasmalogenase [Sedimentisphaerales bacterium]|nr:lysoplasmalogenase [Sedimentisphaerales bacterium]
MNQKTSSCNQQSSPARIAKSRGSIWLLVAFSAVNAFGVTLAVNGRWGELHFPCVLGASTGFVLVALAAGGLHSGYGRFILAGLAAFWCGDVIGGHHYLIGMVAFGLGHALFVCAFAAKGIAWKRFVMALAPVALVLAAILRYLLPHIGPTVDVVAVCAYACMISVVVLAAFGALGRPAGRIALAAAVLIYVSDILVARWRYVDLAPLNGYICYPLYYAACLMLGMSVSARTRCRLSPFIAR